VAPRPNCKKQLEEICEDHGLDDVDVVGLHDLLLKVIDFEPYRQKLRAEKGEEPAAAVDEPAKVTATEEA